MASAPELTWVAGPSPLAASTCCTRRTILESSSTRRIRVTPLSATCGGLAGAESHPAELLPSGLALPGVEQPSQSPVQGQLSVSEILQHRVDQQNQHVLAPSKRQKSALQSVGQAMPEAPGAEQHREHVDQHPIPQRRQEERQQVLVAEELPSQEPLDEKQKEDEGIARDLDQRS